MSFQIPVYASGFSVPYKDANGTRRLQVRWGELVTCAVTVGRSSFEEVFQFDTYSLYEVMHRIYLLKANLRTENGRLHRTDAFLSLDGSEKSGVSYLLGLTFAKVAIARLTKLWWLQHLDTYLRSKGVPRSGRRPDLFVRDATANQAVVVEAKGLSQGYDARTMKSAVEQKNSGDWRKLLGAPGSAVASVAYFRKNGLEVKLRDPLLDDEVGSTGEDASIVRDYYKLVSDFIRTGANQERIGDVEASTREVPGLDIRIGLAEWILRALSEDDETLVRLVLEAKIDHPEKFPVVGSEGRTVSVHEERLLMPDGVAVITGPTWAYR